MTLIAAFWCAGDHAVLCADSQETWGAYKTSVTKLKPQEIGRLYQLAYAGSGLADLVDGLGDALEEGLGRSRASSEVTLKKEIQKIFTEFYESSAVKAYALDPNDPNAAVSGVVCIRVAPLGAVFLFKFSKTIVLPVKDFVLRGIEEPIYHHIGQRLYRPNLLPLQARLLGLHLFTEAGLTSNQIGGPTRVVFATRSGMYADDRNTALYASTVTMVQRAMDDVLLACADTSAVSAADVKAQLRTLGRTIQELRAQHVKQLDNQSKKDLKSWGLTKRSAPRLPKP
jgi:hypothetical protein